MNARIWIIVFAIPALLLVNLRLSNKPDPESIPPESPGFAESIAVAKTTAASASSRPRVSRSTRPGTSTDTATADRDRASEEAARERIREFLDGELDQAKLTTGQLQQHIDTNSQSAESFLAAFQASGDKYWLTNAAALYPDDPSVQLAMISRTKDDTKRREWLERLMNSDPDNALASYLSAQDHFDNGKPEEAIQDLFASVNKPSFNDYSHFDIQSAEEMYLAAGNSPVESKILAVEQEYLPHLHKLHDLGITLVKQLEAASARNDTQTFYDLAQIGMRLGASVGHNEGVKATIHYVLGIDVQYRILRTLQPDGQYPFLQSTPEEAIADLTARRQHIRHLRKNYGDLANAPKNDIIGYFDPMEVHGEINALEWLTAKQAANFP